MQIVRFTLRPSIQNRQTAQQRILAIFVQVRASYGGLNLLSLH
ncbi:Uncharacterised protein [Vibrio cholerae]|nr:Uncharacterised protein [Vibrio cholerae]